MDKFPFRYPYYLKKKSRCCSTGWHQNPDGYVSNLFRCVEKGQKFSGMKSHDSHVFMQRLLPFAFAELLPTNVYEALAGSIL